MRVLIVTNTYPPAEITGVGALVYELARKLDTDGHDVRVLTRHAPAEDPWAVGTGGRKLLFPVAAARHALRLSAERPFDLVHVHESDGVLVCGVLRLARLLRRAAGRARLVATLQVSYRRERLAVRAIKASGGTKNTVVSRPTRSERVFAWVRAPILSLFGRLTARLSDAVVAPSHVTADELRQDYGARVEAVIPNGVAEWPVDASPVQRPADAPIGPTVLYAGRLRTRKAVGVLVEAFAEVNRQLPEASLAIAGDGEHRQTLEDRTRELGLDQKILFLGPLKRDAMVRWYRAADLFCLPSIYEGMPLAILEAMAACLPVVTTTASGMPEAVGDTGLLVEPEDADALADALVQLLDDGTRRRRLGEAARRRVHELFTIEKICGDYLALWESLLSSE